MTDQSDKKIIDNHSKKTETLIQNFQNANRLIRQRAIILSLMLIIVIGFITSKKNREEHISSLQHTKNELIKLRDLDNKSLKNLIENKDTIGIWLLYELSYKLKQSDYKDRTAINQIIDKTDQELEGVNTYSTFNVLGIETPLDLWLLISVVVILILFHDFTQTIYYRRKLLNELESLQVEEWQLGPELFGFYGTSFSSTSGRFINLISSVIVAFILVCPLVTGLMFFDYTGFLQGNMILLNALCLLIISIDTVIVFHTENILGARYLVDLFTGKAGRNKASTIFGMWFLLPALLLCFHLLNLTYFNLSPLSKVSYILNILLTVFLFSLTIWKCYKNEKSLFWIFMRFTFLIMNIFWAFIGLYTISTGTVQHYLDSRFNRWIDGGFIGILIFSLFLSFLYIFIFHKDGILSKHFEEQ